MTPPDHDALRPWATARQRAYLDALKKHKGVRAAARSLGVAHTSIARSLMSLQARAVKQGHSPAHDMTKTVPDGFLVKGVSTFYNRDGKPTNQWVKSAIDHERQWELLQAAADVLARDVAGLAPLVPTPAGTAENLLSVYPLGDPHVGLYSWARETGEHFDLAEAERLTLGAVDRLAASGPASGTGILLALGDVFHANDQTNATPAHRHQLDVDGRFVQALEVGIRTFRHATLRLLEKHARVVVRFVQGNHDPQAVLALGFTIAAYFERDPRVTVDLSPAKHWYYRFGRVLLGATHGDTTKAVQLPGMMAADRAADWGLTKHRHWYCGHVHHSSVREYPGVTVETFRTLAAADSYAAGHGYRAGRDMRLIVLDEEHGEIERHRCDAARVT